MTITLTGPSGSHTPILFDGYETAQESRHVVHDLLGPNAVAITLRTAAPRRGNLRALFPNLEAAMALNADLASAAVLTLTDTENPEINMTFIAVSSSTAQVEDKTRTLGLVEFTYLKVPA